MQNTAPEHSTVRRHPAPTASRAPAAGPTPAAWARALALTETAPGHYRGACPVCGEGATRFTVRPGRDGRAAMVWCWRCRPADPGAWYRRAYDAAFEPGRHAPDPADEPPAMDDPPWDAPPGEIVEAVDRLMADWRAGTAAFTRRVEAGETVQVDAVPEAGAWADWSAGAGPELDAEAQRAIEGAQAAFTAGRALSALRAAFEAAMPGDPGAARLQADAVYGAVASDDAARRVAHAMQRAAGVAR